MPDAIPKPAYRQKRLPDRCLSHISMSLNSRQGENTCDLLILGFYLPHRRFFEHASAVLLGYHVAYLPPQLFA